MNPNEELVEVEVDENADVHDEDDELSAMVSDGDVENDEEMEDLENSDDIALCTFALHSDAVYCAAANEFVPGLILTGGGDDKAFLWKYEYEHGSIIDAVVKNPIELQGHKDTIISVGFNFDGTLALTGSYDGTVRIWSAITGELKQVLEGPEDVEWAEWHPKGNAVVAGSKDGTVWMWLTHNGQCVQVFAGHDGGVSAGCFSKDGKTVCTAGEDGSVRLWAPKSGNCKHVFEGHFGHEAVVTALVSSEDGDMILSGSADGTAKLFQISGKKLLQTFRHGEVGGSVSLTASDGKIASEQSTLFNIKEESNKMDMDDEDVQEAGTLSVECVGFSHSDFRWIATGGLDKTMKVWDSVNGVCRNICRHNASVVALNWHKTLPVVATGALDNIVRLWDGRSGSILVELTGHRDMVTSLLMVPIWKSFAENNADSTATDIVVSVSDDNTAKVFHINPRAMMK